MAQYRCIGDFSVPRLDGFEVNEIEGEEFPIEKDSIWEGTIVPGSQEIYLEQESGAWIDIDRELFELMFERED